MWCKIRVQLHCFACGYPVFPVPFIEKIDLSPLNDLCTLVNNLLTLYVRICFWVFYSISWTICLSLCLLFILHCFDYCFKVRKCVSSNFILLFQDCFGYLGVPWNSIWILGLIFLFLQKECHWDFNRDCIKSVHCFGYYWYLNNM